MADSKANRSPEEERAAQEKLLASVDTAVDRVSVELERLRIARENYRRRTRPPGN